MTERLGREVVYSPLDLCEGHYHIDFARFSRDIQGCKVLILCNPHNPGGRVWTVDELRRIATVCKDSGTMVISDEIHADLTLPPYKHHLLLLYLRMLQGFLLLSWLPVKLLTCPDWVVRMP